MSSAYVPPSKAEMRQRQNTDDSLRLLVAQRTIYSTAKRYLTARLTGMLLIAIAAPIIGVTKPSLAVTCGAVAGAWIFLGRTSLTRRQNFHVDRGAAVQESFDLRVFGMPGNRGRENMPTLEDIAKLTGRKSDVRQAAAIEKLRDWYPLDTDATGAAAVAISQRANVSYSDSLLRTTAKVWWWLIGGWTILAIAFTLIADVDLSAFLLAVFLPLLPAFLDLVEFTQQYNSASHIRRMTAQEIEDAITSGQPIDPGQLQIWQERIYELRRSTPLVPDVIYWMARKANERAMNKAAGQLGNSTNP
jgi:hypothetical protein